jgi:UDP-glucose 4-epimerase
MTHTVNRWTLVFNDLCNQAVLNKQIILRSSGTQHRDFISLHDVSRAMEHLIFQPGVNWQDGLFNLGGNCSLSIAQVAHIIANEYGLVYGIPPSVTLGKDTDNVSSEKVSYNINKLLGTGFTLTGNMKEEIRATFRMCEMKNGICQT